MSNSGEERDGKLVDYFCALQRITSNKPEIVAKGLPITLRLVSLEAGRKGDSIKRGRPQFRHLIDAIDKAAELQGLPRKTEKTKHDEVRDQLKAVAADRDAAIGREISLLYEVYHLKNQLRELTGANVFPLRPSTKRDAAPSNE